MLSVSNTEMQTFQQCRRRWWLTYYRKLRPMETAVVGPLALGSRVHSALEARYKHSAGLVETYDTLLSIDVANAMESGDDLTALASEGELGHLMLEGFIDWAEEEGIDADFEIVGTEEILSMPMLGGLAEVKGKLDLRVRDKRDGTHLVRDWKTSAQLGAFTKWAHLNPQLMLYQTLDYVNTPEDRRIAGGQYVLLKKVKRGPRAKPPFYELLDIRHNVFTLRSYWTRLQGLLSDMLTVHKALDDGGDHRQIVYPTPTRDCSWICPFFTACPMFDDGSGAEDLIAANFVVGNPYDYYNEKEVEV
jgi:PD-(D/E)XK nuclease superfamily